MGPPESPEQESLPPAVRPAQNMLSVMAEVPYSERQEAREMAGTVTFLRLAGRVEPLSVRRPLNYSWLAFVTSRIAKQSRKFLMHRFVWRHSPSGNSERGASSDIRSRSWERGVSNGRALCNSSGEMPDSNVEVGRVGVVGRVVLDSGDAHLSATASPVLFQQVSAFVTGN